MSEQPTIHSVLGFKTTTEFINSLFIDDLPTINLTQKEVSMPTTHDCWEVADAIMGVSRRILLRGKPGTGKTYHAVNSALREDQKVYQITMTEETPAAEIRGHYILKGNEYVWSDGPAITAWREGARLVINEIDHASEDCMSLMYAILDDPEFASLTLPTGETVRPEEGFQIIATMNGIPEDLPDALQDRLPVDIEITDVNPKAIDRLPEDLREPARNTALAKSNARGISVRMWMEFATLRDKLPETVEDEDTALELAAKAIFGGNYREALNALTLSKTASPPQTMDGYIITPDDQEFMRIMRDELQRTPKKTDREQQVFEWARSKVPSQTLFINIKAPGMGKPTLLQRQDESWIPIREV